MNTKKSSTCRGFVPFCTNDQARQHFKDLGLSYADINEGDILVLAMLIQKELKASAQTGETGYLMHLFSRPRMKFKPDGSMDTCFLTVKAPGQWCGSAREAISFNADGFIGFAGWADTGNTNPFLRAFWAWCDALAEGKAKGAENNV